MVGILLALSDGPKSPKAVAERIYLCSQGRMKLSRADTQCHYLAGRGLIQLKGGVASLTRVGSQLLGDYEEIRKGRLWKRKKR